MASRKEQKEAARQRRLAEQQAASEQAQRRRRWQMFGSTIAAVIVVLAVVVIASGGSSPPVTPHSKAAVAAANQVDALLSGIAESGTTLGSPKAPVTVTEYGDLECSVCDEFATPTSFTNPEGEAGTGFEDDLISQYVRAGKVKLVYRSLETASSGNPNASAFAMQQEAANAAGLQHKGWYYIELFYNEQGAEGTGYVTESFLEDIARQIHGLNFARWMTDRKSTSVKHEVVADNALGTAVGEKLPQGVSTPTIIVQGPSGRTAALQALTSNTWNDLQAAIASAT